MSPARAAHDQSGDVASFFHINVNCTDFERSLAFYRLIGFEVVNAFEGDASFGEAGLGPVLRLPDDCAGRAALLKLKGDGNGPRLDLIEWTSPREAAVPPRTLAQAGVGRICLRTLDADAVHARLSAAGFTGYTAPVRIGLGGSVIKVFCVEDPDGVVIEFMEFLARSQARREHSPGP
jgi:catechol 2,3-dioxygenase-like lactoylglutathione lyase family enzyme